MLQNILIFGASGQVANELKIICEREGRHVQIAGRDTFDLTSGNIPDYVRWVRPNGIINASAYTAVDRAEGESEAAFHLNCHAPKEMALAAAALDIPFIHFSTDYVFDGAKTGAYEENDLRNPKTVYGLSKAAGEAALEAIGGRCTILRTSWVFSEFGSNFVKTMLRLAKDRDEVRVVADQKGRPTWAAECARAALATIDRLSSEPLPIVMHAAGVGVTDWANFAQTIFRLSNDRGGPWARVTSIPTSAYPTPAARPLNSVLGTELIESELGLRFQPWSVGLEHVVSRVIGAS